MIISAMAAHGARDSLAVLEIDLGELGPNEVDVRVTHCGVCYTDVGMVDNKWGLSHFPLVPGHEIVGTVAAVGSNVTGLEINQRVAVGAICGSCMNCDLCVTGAQHVCANMVATIFDGHHGGFATHVRAADWRFVFPLPDEIASEHAAPLMCAGSTVFSPFIHCGIRPTDKVAIVGIGGLGHLAIQYAAKWGCDVTAISSTLNKEREALEFGAQHFVSTHERDALKKLRGAFDFILSTVPIDLNWDDYVAALRPQGQLCLTGTSPGPLSLNVIELLSGERKIVGGKTGAIGETRQMLAFTARHGIKPLVELFPMSLANEALNHARAGKARYRAVLVA